MTSRDTMGRTPPPREMTDLERQDKADEAMVMLLVLLLLAKAAFWFGVIGFLFLIA